MKCPRCNSDMYARIFCTIDPGSNDCRIHAACLNCDLPVNLQEALNNDEDDPDIESILALWDNAFDTPDPRSIDPDEPDPGD